MKSVFVGRTERIFDLCLAGLIVVILAYAIYSLFV